MADDVNVGGVVLHSEPGELLPLVSSLYAKLTSGGL